MNSTLLELVSDVCKDPGVGTSPPNTLFGFYDEGDAIPQRLLRAVQRTCHHLVSRYDWQVLKSTHTFNTVNANLQPSGIPSDFLEMVEGTFYISGLQVSSKLDDVQAAGIVANSIGAPHPTYEIINNGLNIYPKPAVDQVASYRYKINSIGVNSSNVKIEKFLDDSDKTLWPDELMRLGIIAFWRKGERLDYASDWQDFEIELARIASGDGSRRILNMAGGKRYIRPSVSIVNPGPVGDNT